MKRKVICTTIFLLSIVVLVLVVSNVYYSFDYVTTDGDDYFHTNATMNILILNFNRSVKNVRYCFTGERTCNDYVRYDGDYSDKIIDIKISYPDNIDGQRLCYVIDTKDSSTKKCESKLYVVDSNKPVITSLYDNIVISDKDDNLEDLFKVESMSGIKKFKCDYSYSSSIVKTINCKATSKNGLSSILTQKAYINDGDVLDGKKVLFIGEELISNDKYNGYAGRIGLGNYMDWYIKSGDYTIYNSDNKMVDKLNAYKDRKFDYIIIEGGLKDSEEEINIGTMSDSKDVNDFITSTYAGGLEELLYYAKRNNPDTKIGFVIPYKYYDEDSKREDYVEITKKICDKWDVKYLDLYSGKIYDNGKMKTYSEILDIDKDTYFREEYYLNSLGYDLVAKYISMWMKTL